MDAYADGTDGLAVPAGARLSARHEQYLAGARIPEVNSEEPRVRQELRDHAGAAPVSQMRVFVHLRILPGKKITITDIALVELVRRAALNGTLVHEVADSMSNGDGPDVRNFQNDVVFDLAESNPVARRYTVPYRRLAPHRPMGTSDSPTGAHRLAPLGRPYFAGATRLQMNGGPSAEDVRLDDDPPQDKWRVDIRARLADGRSSATFKLKLKYHDGQATHHVTIDDRGRPFRLTSPHCVHPGIASYQRARTTAGNQTLSGWQTPWAPSPDFFFYFRC
ncbi:hypothetical protein BKA00_006425 [Actinomadura coerulea]|uniref:Uncharacterized protein n=1 Tax=Actinomadura coerulea TaxID=46159 RepID=A0A7X0L2A2_9ACTN|nr:hypothetical protein [Actinomadura coerulea]MBB6399511.1 hypothetical protein [Actinomadura coerulea]NDU77142.1 hypothetical protein [Actinomadura lepetitiana]